MNNTRTLKPCPFCGHDETFLSIEHMEGTIVHPAYRVHCEWCGASTNYTDKDCIGDWNARPLEDYYESVAEAARPFAVRNGSDNPLHDEIERLREALNLLRSHK